MQNGHVGYPIMNNERKYENNYNVYPNDKYNKFNEAYSEAERSRALINSRLEKLKIESDAIKNIGKNFLPIRVNPNLYSYQVSEPVYYPLENPIKGEPLVLPKIEMGIPVQKLLSKKSKKECNHNCKSSCQNKNVLSISDIVSLMSMNKVNNQNNSNCQNCCSNNRIDNLYTSLNKLNNEKNNNNNNNLNNNKCSQNHCCCDVIRNNNQNNNNGNNYNSYNDNNNNYPPRYKNIVCSCNRHNEEVYQHAILPEPRLFRMNYEQMYRTPVKGIRISGKSLNKQRRNYNNISTMSKASASSKKSSHFVSKISDKSSIIVPSPNEIHAPSQKRTSIINTNAPIMNKMSTMSLNKISPEIEETSSTPDQNIPVVKKDSVINIENNIIKKNFSLKEQIDVPEIKVISPPKPTFDWWKVTRSFVNMYKFFSIEEKLGKNSLVRDEAITKITNSLFEHINTIASWLVTIEDSFISDMKAYNSLNINFTDKTNKNSFKKCSENITSILTKFETNLLNKTSKPSDVPEKIQDILQKFIKENTYLPKKYLSTFEINRLDFNFFGQINNINQNQAAMILVYLIVSRAMIQKILLLPTQSLPQYKNSKNIQQSCFMLGSILHYLVRGAFSKFTPLVKKFLPLVNYYRNYSEMKNNIEDQIENNPDDFINEDIDEICFNLIAENDLNQFWKENASWADSFKQKIFDWGLSLVKIISSKQTG